MHSIICDSNILPLKTDPASLNWFVQVTRHLEIWAKVVFSAWLDFAMLFSGNWTGCVFVLFFISCKEPNVPLSLVLHLRCNSHLLHVRQCSTCCSLWFSEPCVLLSFYLSSVLSRVAYLSVLIIPSVIRATAHWFIWKVGVQTFQVWWTVGRHMWVMRGKQAVSGRAVGRGEQGLGCLRPWRSRKEFG